MIPSVADIFSMLVDGVISFDQAQTWVQSHIDSAEDTGHLRDMFAGLAMMGLVSSTKSEETINLHGAAEWSYNMADAMTKARAK